MDEWKREEYVILCWEIADRTKLQNDLLLGAITVSVAISALITSPEIMFIDEDMLLIIRKMLFSIFVAE